MQPSKPNEPSCTRSSSEICRDQFNSACALHTSYAVFLVKRRLFSISRFCASASPRLANAQSCSLVIGSLFMVLYRIRLAADVTAQRTFRTANARSKLCLCDLSGFHQVLYAVTDFSGKINLFHRGTSFLMVCLLLKERSSNCGFFQPSAFCAFQGNWYSLQYPFPQIRQEYSSVSDFCEAQPHQQCHHR